MTQREREILNYIAQNPMISHQELAEKTGSSKSAVAVHISNLTKKGYLAGKGYVLRLRDEEPQMNVTLLESLRQGFDVEAAGLDPLPQDEKGVDLQAVFSILRQAVLHLPRWEVEERAVIGAAMEAGARRVYLIEEPLAAALGANLDIAGPGGHMVVDIGGGTTDVAVLSMNAVAVSSSTKVAGDAMDEAIMRYVRRKHGVVLGENTAEEVKITIGCVYPRPENASMLVKGRDLRTGLPKETTLQAEEILEALKRPARQIVDEIFTVLERTPPELVADLAQNGIVLTGGGSLIWGMEQLIRERTELPCILADDADSCVAYGCGKSLAWINHMQEGTINLARRRLMQA